MKHRVVHIIARSHYVTREERGERFVDIDLGGIKVSFPLDNEPLPYGQVKIVLEYESPSDANP
jgi:hypothetical protein